MGERWEVVKRLYRFARELPINERAQFLRDASGGEEDLVEEILALLDADAEMEAGFLEPPDAAPHAGDEGELGGPEAELPRTLDDFELLEVLGHGGMGVVYRARQISLDREVAVKVLLDALTVSDRQRRRFQREARSIAKLKHPGLVPIYAVGRAQSEYYFAMELVRGVDLHRELALIDVAGAEPGTGDSRESGEALARLPAFKSREYLPLVARLILGVAEAVQHAHDNGIIHRDIKPQNLLLTDEPRLKLVDFGLARDASMGQLSVTGEVAGTPFYMSPEQVRAKRNPIDQRTDVYSLGVVLYEMLTARRPFEGKTNHEILGRITHDDPVPPRRLNPRVPRDLETICLKAFQKLPADRYASMAEFAADLRRLLDHEAIQAQRPSLARRAARHLERRRAVYASLGIALLALTLGSWLAVRVGEVRAAENLVERLTPWEGAGPDQLGALSERERLELLQLAGEAAEPDSTPEIEKLGREVVDALERFGEGLKTEGRSQVLRGLATRKGQKLQSDAAFFGGLRRLSEARALLPDDAELAVWSRVETYFPQLSIEVSPELASLPNAGGLEVYLQEVEWDRVGELRRLENWRDGAVRVEPGVYRVVSVAPGVGFAEQTRVLHDRGGSYRVAPRIRATAEVTASMISVPRGEPALLGMPGYESIPWFNERRVDLDDFWIEPTEVTNAQYRAFVEETGHRPPIYWEGAYAANWAELPVIGVTWFDAREYAEWAGMRLPSWAEWEKTARGTEGWKYPWGPERGSDAELVERTVVGRRSPDGTEVWPSYLAHVRPVGTTPGDRSPFGAFDMLGNVSEWTESAYLTVYQGAPLLQIGQRVVKGSQWNSAVEPLYLNLLPPVEQSVNFTSAGFRCAKGSGVIE